MSHRHELVERLVELQNVANALKPGADRAAVQAATANVIRAVADQQRVRTAARRHRIAGSDVRCVVRSLEPDAYKRGGAVCVRCFWKEKVVARWRLSYRTA